MKRAFIRLIIAFLVAAGAPAIAAELTLFEEDNFGGQRFVIDSNIQNQDISGLTFAASSVRIRTGSWLICDDAYYRGKCVTLSPGQYPNLRSMGINNRVHSVREFSGWPDAGGGGAGGGGGGRPGGGGGGPGSDRGAEVVLYDLGNFGGQSFGVNGDMSNLDSTGFNDRAQSMIVNEGRWELCGDWNYGGGCQVFGPGRYADLGSLSDRVSSLRRVAAGGGGSGGSGGGGPGGGVGGGPGGGGGGPGWGNRNRAVLYEGPNLTGRTYVITTDSIRNLDGTGFNDRASSLRVERGYWLFCSDMQFQGECRTFGPGDYPTLPRGLNDAISSGRKISDDYPYNQPPNWGR